MIINHPVESNKNSLFSKKTYFVKIICEIKPDTLKYS